MRKILLTVVAACGLLVLAPAGALAHGHFGHHRRHHGRHHFRMFGNTGMTGGQSQNAGTVQSYTGGVLTIALSSGSTVSGQVTNATNIICQSAPPTSMQSSNRNWDGNGGPGNSGDDQGQADDKPANQSCGTTNLTSGTVVRAAELRLSGAGAVWDAVVLVTQSSSQSSQPSSAS
jgi:hypothetical protein